MIKHQGEYLVVQEDAVLPPQNESPRKEEPLLSTQGSVEERMGFIRQQISRLKAEKQAKARYNKTNVFTNLSHHEEMKRNPVQVQLHTPKELYDLTKRVHDIEAKVGRTEIFNQTVHRKGNLMERVKALQEKLEKLQKMPTEAIIINISSYHSLAENKEEHFKYLFLYEQFLKTQGLKEEYVTVKQYLQNLKYIHEQSALLGPTLMKLHGIHQDILSKADSASQLYQTLYTQLVNDYKLLNGELTELEK